MRQGYDIIRKLKLLRDTCRLRGEKYVAGARHELVVLCPGGRKDEGSEKPRPVADVVVGVILGQVEDVLREQGRLLRIGQTQLRGQVDRLEGFSINFWSF